MYDLSKKNWVLFNYQDWNAYFKRNDKRRLEVNFDKESEISKEDREKIFKSISAFQVGEHSDGIYLAKLALKFAQKEKEELYPETMNLFIKEENYHSAYLAWYMDHYGVKKAERNKLDKFFRMLRHNGNLFTEISVLVTAEIIALSYYSALGNVADKIGSPALRSICNQMLHDELPHIVFQSYTLSFYSNNNFVKLYRKLLMDCTTLAVYFMYGNVLREGGYDYKCFRKENIGYLNQSLFIVDMNRF